MTTLRETLTERAGIIEYSGNMPRKDAEKIALTLAAEQYQTTDDEILKHLKNGTEPQKHPQKQTQKEKS